MHYQHMLTFNVLICWQSRKTPRVESIRPICCTYKRISQCLF